MPAPARAEGAEALAGSLPPAGLLRDQARWFAAARARLLRRCAVALRRRVLDLGAGYGAVTGELVRRSGGAVVALDLALDALRADPASFAGAVRACGDAARLPFAAGAFDLVLCQCALMWMPADGVLGEVRRVLQAGGALVALEPDYGGMMEQPPAIATRDLWIAALTRAGADPSIGRRLPALLEARGFDVRVDLLPELLPPDSARFDLLRGLPLTQAELAALQQIEQAESAFAAGWARIAHLPFFLVTAVKK